jgi:prepilin-type N-terminal cleavage/methylation domain-containing protein
MNSNAKKTRYFGTLGAMAFAIAGHCCSEVRRARNRAIAADKKLPGQFGNSVPARVGATVSWPPAKVGMQKNGFTLVEILIGLMVIGVLSVIVVGKINGAQSAATTLKCYATIEAFASDVDALAPSGPPPTQEQVRQHIDWAGRYKDYWYIPNNSDFNNGHGNDLDGCDEENPGNSLPGRECIPMRFLIVCMHETHGNNSDAKYIFHIGGGLPPQIVAYEEFQHTYLQDAKWWPRDDPHFDRWIGAVPKK